MSQPLLVFRGVGFHYGRREVVRSASFTLEPGTATALIGPNGAGKTTLLRLASGVLQPASGAVEFEGRPLKQLTPRQAAQQIAIVPQQLDVPFDYTVEEVVAQGRTPYLSLLGGLGAADRRELDWALDVTNTGALRYRVFNELSGGERQRVKIALGLAQRPKLLLLDEPTQNLDIGRQIELLDLLQHLRQNGLTILASIHDLHLIQNSFSTVILLRASESLIAGPPDRILERSLLGAAFDCPSSNHPLFEHLLPGRIKLQAQPEALTGDPQ